MIAKKVFLVFIYVTLSISLFLALMPLVLHAVAAAPILLESIMFEADDIDEF